MSFLNAITLSPRLIQHVRVLEIHPTADKGPLWMDLQGSQLLHTRAFSPPPPFISSPPYSSLKLRRTFLSPLNGGVIGADNSSISVI